MSQYSTTHAVAPLAPCTRRAFLDRCIIGVAVLLSSPRVARATPIDYPERPVREFLAVHFQGTRAFTASGMTGKERFLSRRLRRTLFNFFERAMKTDSPLSMVNDPFTGSQGARHYVVGDGKVRSEKAWVPVRFSDGTDSWSITYLLRNDQERNDERWRIHDIEDRRGMLLTEALDTLK
jgi:hypothetical protein